MPVIEVLLFGAALAIGGPRAWEKFQTERAGSSSLFWGRDEEADKLPPTTPPGKAARPLSMPSSPRYFSLLEGTAVNWRSQGASPRVSTADVALSGPTSGSSGKGEGLEFGAMLHSALSILSPRSSRPRSPDTTDFAESPRTNGECLSPRPLSARGEQEERADWSWVMRLTGREQKDVARVTSDDEDTGDWQSKVRRAVLNLAGEGLHTKKATCDDQLWSPRLTPRQSAMKRAGDSPLPSPRGELGRGRVRFATYDKLDEVVCAHAIPLWQVFSIHDSPEEILSRRRRWAYILRVAEREACEAISAPPKTRSVPSPRGRSEQPDLHTAGGDTRGARVQVPKLNLAAVTVSSSNSSPRGRR